ncbi:hypothetical protein EYF80_037633 [Liparis tanakae]|uniref:Uncharacterized protein n=1 Tax=Liparis tanakae TaxID=230148 RepID=A0A4Z2GFY5_9TELE|nr:hypothetical protein EYF80_037633 [Liparis tanakae]
MNNNRRFLIMDDSKFIPKATPMRPNKEREKVPIDSCRLRRIITLRWLESNRQQIDEDDTLRVVYQPFQLSGLVPQLLRLYGAGYGHNTNMWMTFNMACQMASSALNSKGREFDCDASWGASSSTNHCSNPKPRKSNTNRECGVTMAFKDCGEPE